MTMKKTTKLNFSDILMASAALAWGFSYIFMKLGLATIPPLELGFLRFAIAFPFLLLIFRQRALPNSKELRYSAVLGFFIFLLTAGYNFGLRVTDASTAGFLAGTTVAVVPLLRCLRDRALPEKKTVLGVVLTCGGVALLSLKGDLILNGGALCCLGGAVAYAFQILLSDTALEQCRPLPLALWQLGFAALYCGVTAVATEELVYSFSATGWLAILGLALISSAYGYIAQTFAQRKVTPERIGFLYSLEPVFCAVLAFFFFGEIMGVKELGGAVLILLSIIFC